MDWASILAFFGGSTGVIAAVTAAVRFGAPAFALAMKHREEAKLVREDTRLKVAERQVIEAQAQKTREEDTGRVYKDTRADLEKSRVAEQDCRKEVDKLRAECRERDDKTQKELVAARARLSAQEHGMNQLRATVQLYQSTLERIEKKVGRI